MDHLINEPIEAEDIELGYTIDNTNGADSTGLVFFQRNKKLIENNKSKVLVYTVRGDDEDLKLKFINNGLKPENFINKVACSNVNDLLNEIKRILHY